MTIDLNERIWHDAASAAEYADCSAETIRRNLSAGLLVGSKPFGRWRIHRDALDAWLGGVA